MARVAGEDNIENINISKESKIEKKAPLSAEVAEGERAKRPYHTAALLSAKRSEEEIK